MSLRLKLASGLCASAMLASPVFAQTPNAPPPCQEDVYRDFDFWLGEWEVTQVGGAGDGKVAGTNSITSQEAGCLIVENWTNTGGGTGQSYNFYDPGLEQWRQVWVSAGAVIDYSGGLNEKGEMVLEGEIRNHGGPKAPFRGIWTPNEDGSVLQNFEQYDEASGEWQTWFKGLYRPKG